MKIIYTIAILLCGFGLRAQMDLPENHATNSAPRPPTRIDSDSADFDMSGQVRKAYYHGHVVVIDPQMRLTCAEMVVDIPASGHIQRIVAETNVVIDFADEHNQTNHVTADKAVYDFKIENGVTNETVTFTGHAHATTPQLDIVGEPLVWDRAKQAFHAEHETIYSRQSLNFMPTNSMPTMTMTNKAAQNTNKPATTNASKLPRQKK